jgi:iron complex outermembrane recepter protein
MGYTGLRIRGTDANRINMTVNGIPLNDAESHGVWFVNMPDFAGSTENIQIQRGVGTSTNGAAAFGASINFQTLAISKKAYGEIHSSVGSFNSNKNSAGFGTGLLNNRYSFDTRFSWINSDGYIDRASSNLSSWFISGASVKEKSLLKLILFSGKEKTYQAWDGVPGYLLDSMRTYNGMGMYTDDSGTIRYYDNETDNYAQNHYQLHYSHEIDHSVHFTAALHLTRGIGYYEQYKEDQDLFVYNIPDIHVPGDTLTSSDLIRRKWLDNYFYGGVFSVNIKRSRLEALFGGGINRYDGNHYGTVIWARYAGISEIKDKWYKNTGIKTDFNNYAKINYSLSNALNIYGDLQIRGISYRINGRDDDKRDITQDHKFLFLNPKIGLNLKINENHRSFISFSVAGREPNRDNFVDAVPGRPYPQPETLFDYEAGYDFHSENLLAGLNLYYMDYKNQLVLTGEINDVGSAVMTNVRDSYRAGIEAVIGFKISETFKWNMNINMSTNKIKKFMTYVDNWDYWDDPENEPLQYQYNLGSTNIAFSPRIVAGNNFKFILLKNLSVDFYSKYVGKQFIDNTNSRERQLDPWFVNDLRLKYTFHPETMDEISINLLIANIFSEKYESNAWVYRYMYQGSEYKYDGYFPQAGINFLAGISIKF